MIYNKAALVQCEQWNPDKLAHPSYDQVLCLSPYSTVANDTVDCNEGPDQDAIM